MGPSGSERAGMLCARPMVRWMESAQLSWRLVEAMRQEVIGAGGGDLALSFYLGVVPRVNGLGWVFSLKVWEPIEGGRRNLLEVEREVGAWFGADLLGVATEEYARWMPKVREIVAEKLGVSPSRLCLG